MSDKLLEEVLQKIDAKTITCEDFNRLIAETTPESIRDRIRRRTIKNETDSHQDEDGHQQLQLPSFNRRVMPKRKPEHQQSHGRAKLAHRHSAKTQEKTMSASLSEALEFVIANVNKPISESLIKPYNQTDLRKVITTMMLKSSVNRDWLYELLKCVDNANR